jgi:hypothetical protein
MSTRAALEALVAAQFDREVSPRARALAEAARQRCPGTLAVVVYGSCLRGADAGDGVLDLYVLVDAYETTYDRWLLVWLNRLLPPNVFFLAVQSEGVTVRAKYAVVTLSSFVSFMADTTRESYFWGRFSQPSAVVFAASPEVARSLAQGLATAVETFVRNALVLVAPTFSARELWIEGLSHSYNTELRAEGPDRSVALFATFADYYEAATPLALAAMPFPVAGDGTGWTAAMPAAERARRVREWRKRRVYSKCLSLLRILRNGYTVEGGPEYVMWKIERHGEFRFDKDWRSKPVPLIALARELWRAWRAGAFR